MLHYWCQTKKQKTNKQTKPYRAFNQMTGEQITNLSQVSDIHLSQVSDSSDFQDDYVSLFVQPASCSNHKHQPKHLSYKHELCLLTERVRHSLSSNERKAQSPDSMLHLLHLQEKLQNKRTKRLNAKRK